VYIKIWGLGREAPNVIPRMAPMAAPQKNKKLILEEASTTLTGLSPLETSPYGDSLILYGSPLNLTYNKDKVKSDPHMR